MASFYYYVHDPFNLALVQFIRMMLLSLGHSENGVGEIIRVDYLFLLLLLHELQQFLTS